MNKSLISALQGAAFGLLLASCGILAPHWKFWVLLSGFIFLPIIAEALEKLND